MTIRKVEREKQRGTGKEGKEGEREKKKEGGREKENMNVMIMKILTPG